MSIEAAVAASSADTSPSDGMARLVATPSAVGVQGLRVAPVPLAVVIALHAALAAILVNYRTDVPEPPRPVMVTLIAPEPAPPAPEPEITPPKPLPATPKPVKKKVEPKPQKKPEPVPVAEPEPRLVSQAPEPSPAPAVEPPAPAPEVAPPPQAQPEPAKAAPPEPVEEEPLDPPRFNADYLDNPAPNYPPLSRRLREQGKVLLRVHVAAGGTAMAVTLHKSSGYSRLDQVALDTVKRWKFIPARQGDKPVDAWVIVPINFNLKG